MALIERMKQLTRLAHPSAWRFLALTISDPRWQPLYDSLARSNPRERFKDPVPWFTWHAVEVLAKEIEQREGQAVLEWGMGGSTLWYHAKGLRVTAIEHDRTWFDLCRSHLAEVADLRLIEEWGEYTRPTLDLSDFDVFVIDGRRRVDCALHVAEHIRSGEVRSGSLVVFDDTQRERYLAGFDALADLCRRHRSYSGAQSTEIDQVTTIFWT